MKDNLKKIKSLFMRTWPIFLIVVIIFLTVLFLFFNPKNRLKKIVNKMEKLNSVEMNLDLTLSSTSQGISMEIPFQVQALINNKSKVTKLIPTLSFYGMNMNTEGYISYNDGSQITYLKDFSSDTWSKSEESLNIDISIVKNIINVADKIKKVKSNEKGIKHYKLTISKEKMNEFLNAIMDIFENSDTLGIVENSGYNINNDIVIDLYTNKKYITKINMDLSNVVEPIVEEDQISTLEITKLLIDITFDNFNNVEDITIPEDVINSALDETLATAKYNAQKYMETIKYTYMYDEDKTNVTDIDLDDKIKPELVDVTLKDGEVISGKIVISGITCTIEDGKITTVN